MSNAIRRSPLRYLFVFVIGCASGQTERPTVRASGVARAIDQLEIRRSGARNAHEAIVRLRPRLLMSQRDRASTVAVQVYMDGVRLGSIEALKEIPSSAVGQIRWLDGREATIWFGTGNGVGAWVITSRVGSTPR
jgi:hypothetical protein